MKIAGLKNINVSLGDKASAFIPPYETKMEQAYIKTKRDSVARGFTGWHRDDLHRYFIAGGGTESEYDEYVETTLQDQRNELEAIEKGTFHTAGGNISYLISGYKI